MRGYKTVLKLIGESNFDVLECTARYTLLWMLVNQDILNEEAFKLPRSYLELIYIYVLTTSKGLKSSALLGSLIYKLLFILSMPFSCCSPTVGIFKVSFCQINFSGENIWYMSIVERPDQ